MQKNNLVNLAWSGKYDEILETTLLKKYDFIFTFNNESFISWIVRYITKTEISHMGIYIGDGKVLHSTLDGSRVDSLKSFFDNQDNIIFIRNKNIIASSDDKCSNIKNYVGIPYSYKSIFSKFIRFFFGYFSYQYRLTYLFDFSLLIFLLLGAEINTYFIIVISLYSFLVFIFYLFRSKIGIDLTNPGMFFRDCYMSNDYKIVAPDIRKMNEHWFIKMFNEKN